MDALFIYEFIYTHTHVKHARARILFNFCFCYAEIAFLRNRRPGVQATPPFTTLGHVRDIQTMTRTRVHARTNETFTKYKLFNSIISLASPLVTKKQVDNVLHFVVQ